MKKYLLIETKSPWNNAEEFNSFLSLVGELLALGNLIDLYFIQDAVLMTKKSIDKALINKLEILLNDDNISLWVDDFSMAQRSVYTDDLIDNAQQSNMSQFVNMMTSDDCKVIWHS